MSTENILLFSVFIVIYTYIYKKRCKQSVKTRLQRFLFLFCHTAVRLKNRTVISGFILYSADSSLE